MAKKKVKIKSTIRKKCDKYNDFFFLKCTINGLQINKSYQNIKKTKQK